MLPYIERYIECFKGIGKRRTQLIDHIREKREYWKLKKVQNSEKRKKKFGK